MNNRYRDWNYVYNGQPIAHPISGHLNINNGPALLDAAIRGAGIVVVAGFLATEAVRDGRLKLILRDFNPPGPTFWIGYLARRHVSPRVRALVNFLTARVPTRLLEDALPQDDVLAHFPASAPVGEPSRHH
jgi:DNA-binding transcriptional LysR family regulator